MKYNFTCGHCGRNNGEHTPSCPVTLAREGRWFSSEPLVEIYEPNAVVFDPNKRMAIVGAAVVRKVSP